VQRKNKRRTMTEWTVYDCAQLNHCCGPCTDDASSLETYNKRMHDITYQNVLLNNVFLCEECFYKNMQMHDDSDIRALHAADMQIHTKMKKSGIQPL
jgi:hypothetical protein